MGESKVESKVAVDLTADWTYSLRQLGGQAYSQGG